MNFLWNFCTIFLLSLFRTSYAVEFDRASCQSKGALNLTLHCPPGTTLVGQNGQFKSIQSAIKSISNDGQLHIVLVQPGTYHEQVNISRSSPIYLLGVTDSPDDHSHNKVKILWKQATGTQETGKADNAFTSALTVAPTLDSSLTGSGPTGHAVAAGTKFGNSDFRAYNIDFVNDFKPYSAGPSLAVSISYANAGFYFCRIRSYQDTVSFII